MIFDFIKTKARIVTNSGLVLVGELLKKAGFRKGVEEMESSSLHPRCTISNADVLIAQIGIMCSGQSTYESVVEYKDDSKFYEDALEINQMPSSATLRQRLNEIAASTSDKKTLDKEITKLNIDLLQASNPTITPLESGLYPLAGDVTPYDESKSHKEGVSRTYKGFDGYSPMNIYLCKEGYQIATEFREGKQHCQKGTPELLTAALEAAESVLPNARFLVRLDSGNDAAVNLGRIMEKGHYFIVKRNLRSESLAEWLDLAKKYAPIHDEPREGKVVHIGSTWKQITYESTEGKKCTKTLRIVFEVTERTIDKTGQVLMFPDIEVNTWWDNTGFSDKDVIASYHDHATMEQFHSEIKTDMGMEKLPSGKFATNQLIHDLSMIAYNILRIIGSELAEAPDLPMRGDAFRRRIKTVILNIVRAPGRVSVSGRKKTVDLGCSNVWNDTIIWVAGRIQQPQKERCCA